MLNPAISYTLDSRPMVGTTYQERSAPGVSLDSRPMEGALCLEPLEQSVLHSTLVVRQVGSVTDLESDWKPVINPVQDNTPDGRLMEETAYLEPLAAGESLDSGLRVGMSSIELPRQSVLYMSSVIRPDETDRPEHRLWHHKCTTNSRGRYHRRCRCRIRILMFIQMSTWTYIQTCRRV